VERSYFDHRVRFTQVNQLSLYDVWLGYAICVRDFLPG
jgi:hypothetical protein